MTLDKSVWGATASTSLFVLLWSSGAIFARLGLDHASPFAFLTLRFALAFATLLLLCNWRGQGLPERGSRLKVAGIGLLLIGGYTICYLLALDNGITPGVLAALLGVQPILTLVVLERRFPLARLLGLGVALGGLVLLVWQSIGKAQVTSLGLIYALASLGSMTVGAILQKGLQQSPMQLLPVQYGASLLACLLLVPYKPFHFEVTLDFAIPLLWLALVISVVAQLLLYRLMQAGNLVNVTSLFYLVPVVTAGMDYLFLGNALAPLGLAGMGGILAGLVLVFGVGSRSG
ncbi:DMT family transporter [Pseudomonas resinovorans]|uniref:DMT family transporter n=1 Tax=Metapseudomonas resinovorans TaxID=53412 RepID=UPI00237F5F39|nr:DMT family transporter [Pseudomonas resinovorans]MDE3736338.1 DMT family transporter [Pseudomonas resinovorans]